MRSQTLPLKVKLKFVTIKSGGQYVNQAIFIFIFKFQMNNLLLLFVTNLDSQLHVSLHNINYYLMRLLKFCITNVCEHEMCLHEITNHDKLPASG